MGESELHENGWTIPRMVDKLWNDAYHGNGKPGIISRIEKTEEAIDDLRDCKTESADYKALEKRVTTLETILKESAGRREKKMNIILATTLAALAGVIVELLRTHVH